MDTQETLHNSRHARAARRAVRQCVAANMTGDKELATIWAQLAAQAVDRHLALVRVRAPSPR